jgi:hypothetical protein
VRELSLCGSNDHVFKNLSSNNEKVFELIQIRKLELDVLLDQRKAHLLNIPLTIVNE